MIVTATRRLTARPDSVAFVARGRDFPWGTIVIRQVAVKRPVRLSWAQACRARADESVFGSAGLGGHVAVWPSQRMPTIATICLRKLSTKPCRST